MTNDIDELTALNLDFVASAQNSDVRRFDEILAPEFYCTNPDLGQEESLMLGVIVPMTLLGLSFAVLVAPLTASVMSSVDQTDEGLASGVNNAASRIAQLAGVALAAGVASFESGYELGLAVAAATSIGGAFTASITPTPAVVKVGGSGGA
jgi:predicted MFS family arabinose efflux permease